MKVLKISFVLDLLFYFLILFLLSFVWIRYFVHNNAFMIMVCLIISACTTILIAIAKIKKNSKQNTTNKEICLAKDFSLEMLYLTKKEQCLKLCSLLSIQNENPKEDYILKGTTIIKPMYEKFECNQLDLIKFIATIKHKKVEQIIFCAPTFDESTKNFKNQYNNIQTKLINENQLYSLVLKPLNYKSNLIKLSKISKKEKLKTLCGIAFNNKKTKSYIFYALTLFCFSFFYRYNIYYIVACSIFLIFALFSKFNKTFNQTKDLTFF